MGYYVYVLESEECFQKYYVGMTKNTQNRLKEHNAGKSKYTKTFRPWKIIHMEFIGDAKEARKIEKYYKSTAGKNKLRKLKIIQ